MIRYPGSKAGLKKSIRSTFPTWLLEPLFQPKSIEYREPFFGGGAIGFDVLGSIPRGSRVWINDKDLGVACLWRTVHEDHEWLLRRISEFEPTVAAFEKFKEEDGADGIDPRERGFRKLALHQMSFSGLGAMAGGPIGGASQSNPKYDIACRWNSVRHCVQVVERNRVFRRFQRGNVKISSGDFAPLLSGDDCAGVFVYADPPYYVKGGDLYKFNMSEDDHRRLASLFRAFAGAWVLSYDDHPFIRELYEWADFANVDKTYTMAISHNKRRKNSEVIITPPSSRRAAVAL